MKRVNIKCPYCGAAAQLRPASALGKTSPAYAGKRYYVCSRYPFCDSYVEAHKESGLPMGTLASKQLRRMRRDAHLALDRLWKRGYMTRAEAYRWLQTQMGIPKSDAHIASFSEYRCDEVIRMCNLFANAAAA